MVCALRAETRTLIGKHVAQGECVELYEGTLLALSGIGAQHARGAGQMLLRRGAGALLSWGTAAGLDPALPPGSLIVPAEVIDTDGRILSVCPQWHARLLEALAPRLPVHTGRIVEHDSVLTEPQDKHELHARTDAVAVDMESAALAMLAQEHGVPFAAIRAIADTSDARVPQTLIDAVDSVGGLPLRGVITAVVLRPGDWPTIARLASHLRSAQTTLRQAANCLRDNGVLAP